MATIGCPSRAFCGGKVRAHHAVRAVARVGDLLVDTGACASVCRPDAFKAEVDLFSVDDSPLSTRGEVRPHLTIGSGLHGQDAQVSFQVVEGITENILFINRALDDGASVLFSPDDCHIKWPDGSKAQFERRGRQFILPYREKANPHGQVRVAPVGDDPEAEAVEAYAALEFASDEEPEAMALEPAGEEPEDGDLGRRADRTVRTPPPCLTAAERSAHQLTHLPFQQWCELCVAGKAKEDHHRRRVVADEVQSERLPIIQMDYMFLGRHGEDVEAESALMTILVAVDLETGYPFTMQVPRKGLEQGKYALENLELFLNKLGDDKCILQHDAEHAVGAVAKALQRHVGARRLQVRSAPVRSHQSQGAVESNARQLNAFAGAIGPALGGYHAPPRRRGHHHHPAPDGAGPRHQRPQLAPPRAAGRPRPLPVDAVGWQLLAPLVLPRRLQSPAKRHAPRLGPQNLQPRPRLRHERPRRRAPAGPAGAALPAEVRRRRGRNALRLLAESAYINLPSGQPLRLPVTVRQRAARRTPALIYQDDNESWRCGAPCGVCKMPPPLPRPQRVRDLDPRWRVAPRRKTPV